jgi:soluble lytic murein transglycosylase-like protein
MPSRPAGCAAALLLACLAAGAARADLYHFRDDAGVPHFSDPPTDPRARLYLRAGARPALAPAPAGRVPPARRARLTQEVAEAARRARLDPALLHAVIAVESAYDPAAVSPKGALGLMQLMPATAARYGVRDPFDVEQNLAAGASHLRGLIDRYAGDTALALAAYNAGSGAVQAAGGRIPPYAETRRYVPAVLRRYAELRGAPSYAD